MLDTAVPTAPGAMFATLLGTPVPASLRHSCGRLAPLHLDRFLGHATTADRLVAAQAAGPTLDVGCGPGRMLDALTDHGTWALGIDSSRAAVALARGRRRRAIHRDVFGALPGDGHWRTALLMDGNIGIGGDAPSLLARVKAGLRAGGTVLAEVEPPGATTGPAQVRLESARAASAWFAWATVGVDDIARVAAAGGLTLVDTFSSEERWFACLA